MRPAALALLVGMTACGSTPSRLVDRDAPGEIRSACELTEYRCTKCHSLDRLRLARIENAQHWVFTVDRMRRQRGSGISFADRQVILRCLVWRSFGWQGLKSLDEMKEDTHEEQ